ncbi:cytochrome P450 [Pleurocapsales cyanobacterium LEGE 06147]|nr:cytochrome P450 [Pleurocapsales cyanobacterium LEGE 06147]
MSKNQAPSAQVIEKRNRHLPPGPRGYLLLKLSELQHQPIEYLDRLWREYGDLVRLPIVPGFTFYLAAHPDHAEHILSTHQERYRKPDFFLKPMGLVQGQGLFTSEGELWLKHRRLMQPAFHQKQLVNLYAVMLSCVQSLLREWEKKPEGEVIDIAAEMTRLTLKIVSSALFSVDISGEYNRLGQAFRTALEYVYYRINTPLAPPVWIPTPRNLKFRQAKQTLDRVVLEIIQARRHNLIDNRDLLSMLLTVRDEVTGEGMSDRQLHDEVITLIDAGHETTATTLAWTWYLLGTHPDVMANLLDEVQTVFNEDDLTFEKLPQLQYTRRVLDESLRLRPPGLGLAPRVALEDDEIQGYFIPKGSIFNIAVYFISRHPEFWDNPERFDPDRFLPENVIQRPKFAYLPFGAGSHTCIGKNFALMESTLILAAIAQRFSIELVPHQSIEIEPRFTLRPKYGIKVTVQKRY